MTKHTSSKTAARSKGWETRRRRAEAARAAEAQAEAEARTVQVANSRDSYRVLALQSDELQYRGLNPGDLLIARTIPQGCDLSAYDLRRGDLIITKGRRPDLPGMHIEMMSTNYADLIRRGRGQIDAVVFAAARLVPFWLDAEPDEHGIERRMVLRSVNFPRAHLPLRW